MTTIVMYNSFLLWWRLRWRRRWRWQRWWRWCRRWRRCQPGLWGASNWRRKHFSGLDTSPPARSYLQFMVKRWSIDNFLTWSLSPIQECGTFVYDGLTTLEVDFLGVGKASPSTSWSPSQSPSSMMVRHHWMLTLSMLGKQHHHHRHHHRDNHLRPWWSDSPGSWLVRGWSRTAPGGTRQGRRCGDSPEICWGDGDDDGAEKEYHDYMTLVVMTRLPQKWKS